MRNNQITTSLSVLVLFLLISCGGGTSSEEQVSDNTEELVTNENIGVDLSAGEAIYMGKGICFSCHQPNGEGLIPNFPPLANADYLLENTERAIHQAIYGSKEPITVNGVTYPGGVMTVTPLSDQEVADVVNFILNSWGNNGGNVTLEDVQKVRAEAEQNN
ncbi:c-type cytochrome [Bacteroidota bacterium]